ncbi:MAG: futalosine hydrolase [Bacteroidia bacterium]
MKLLIVTATSLEILPLLNHTGIEAWHEGDIFKSVLYNGIHLDILITGVGMVATAYWMGKKLNSSYTLVINAGICGAFNRNIEIGDVVNVVEDTFSELGAQDDEVFLSLSELNLQGITTVHNVKNAINNEVVVTIPKVNGISVNTVHGNELAIEKVIKKFHPMIESMEGAAFMMACDLEQVEYVQLRAVSNYVERRNRENWNIPLAIKNLNNKLLDVINVFQVKNK